MKRLANARRGQGDHNGPNGPGTDSTETLACLLASWIPVKNLYE